MQDIMREESTITKVWTCSKCGTRLQGDMNELHDFNKVIFQHMTDCYDRRNQATDFPDA